MQKMLVTGLLALFLFACTDTPAPTANTTNTLTDTLSVAPQANSGQRAAIAPPPPLQTLRGMYQSGTNGDAFYDCTAGKTYRVNAKPKVLDSLYRQACQPAPYDNESVYAVARGYVTPRADASGAPASIDGEFSITGIDTMTAKSMFNTCRPFDFWCMGTEPFWGLLISEQEAGLFLKNIGADQGKAFPWAAPKVKGDSWTYTTTDRGTKGKVNVVVRKTACSDGMSDRRYNYAVEIRIGEQTLQGCAIRYGERVVRE